MIILLYILLYFAIGFIVASIWAKIEGAFDTVSFVEIWIGYPLCLIPPIRYIVFHELSYQLDVKLSKTSKAYNKFSRLINNYINLITGGPHYLGDKNV